MITKGLSILEATHPYLFPKKPNETREFWVDTVCALIALAILQQKPHGTKLSLSTDGISFNEPGLFQSYVRTAQGNSRNDIYNLSPAIYYSIQWLKVADHPKYKIILDMAKKGIEHLIRTYSDCLSTQQQLTAAHLRMLNDGLSGVEIKRSDFMIPDHDENALNKNSHAFWTRNGEEALNEVLTCLTQFQKRGGTQKLAELQLLEKIKEAYQSRQNYLDATVKGRELNSFDPPTDFQVLTISEFEQKAYEKKLEPNKEELQEREGVFETELGDEN